MPNTYFQFKQFRIEQARCAMKVCTDSCLFGASVPVTNAASILDIGTGTGLLALMAAQRSPGVIHALELEGSAAQQAAENFAASPWADRLTLYPTSLQDFARHRTRHYDTIICNPPFYLDSLKSPTNAARNQALHVTDLSFEDLLQFTQNTLSPGGSLHVLLPPREADFFTRLAPTFNLHPQHQLRVYTREGGKHIRSILHYQTAPTLPAITTDKICIRQTDNQYTPAFRQLLHPYYLIF